VAERAEGPTAEVDRLERVARHENVAGRIRRDAVAALVAVGGAELLRPGMHARRREARDENVGHRAHARERRAAEVDRVREVAGDGDVSVPVDRDAVAALVAVVREVLRPEVVAVRVELRDEDVEVGREGYAERAAAEVGGAAEVAREIDVPG